MKRKSSRNLFRPRSNATGTAAALQRQQAEEAQKKQEQKLGKVEGVNSPSDDHQIDIYI
jgi:hypothetical protein